MYTRTSFLMLVPLFSIVIKLEGPLQVPLKVKVKVRSGQVRL